MAEPVGYWKALATLLKLAEHPEAAAVRAEMGHDLPRGWQAPADSTIAGWMEDRVPRRDADLKLFVSALQRMALARQQRNPVRPFPTSQQWEKWAERARTEKRRGSGGSTGSALPSPTPSRASGTQQGWRKDIADSPVWQLVRPDAAKQSETLREQAQQLADRLDELYDETRPALDGDPWRDEYLARRISRRTNQVVLQLWRGREGFLAPAEAALIALLPFLHQVHRSRTAAELSHVDPTDLGHRPVPDEDRRMYEVLLSGHERLVRRAELGGLDDRRDGRPEIGWWLFHQWARRQPGKLPDLLSDMNAHGVGLDDLAVVLEPDLLSRLLYCAHAGPAELFAPARAEHLREHAFQLDFNGHDFQEVRERLVGPLFAVAHAMAIDATDLSSVIVRHVGIPEALDPGSLLTTIEKASWTPRHDGIGLKAACAHPAVVAALSEHTQRFESLLRVVRRAGAREFGELPLYTWADEVREVDDKGAPVPVDGIIRFRLDEERVQELLMGENLYHDRSLAIRELYQNALDACRYRRARARAADKFSAYEGVIEFTQGFDEGEGRHYLECRDNGVGMDELTLSEVFSQAGIRFTDLPRYREEQQEWQSRGVTLHPNSRFGIGVLSYFMLADEVRVTTCHMDPVGGRLREITVLITGPGHYFRVRPTGKAGTIGTTVRLYLREGDKSPSCVRELRRFLGIAEFATTAEHGGPPVKWDPGIMRPREPMGLQASGFEAHGHNVSWSAGPRGEDGQVVWCEHGGGILVDGIHTEPKVRRGILSSPRDSQRLRGVVVNLTGATRPRRLSVDRTEILDDDVCADVERLVRGALPTLLSAEPPLLTHEWLAKVANHSLRLADIVTEAAGAAGYEFDVRGTASAVAVAGFFPSDVDIVRGDDLERGRPPRGGISDPADDPTRLWRLLAHRPNSMLTALAAIVPELNRVESVLPALPSDNFARTTYKNRWNNRDWPSQYGDHRFAAPGHGLLLAAMCGLSYREVVARMAELRLPTPEPPMGNPAADEINLALLSSDLRGPGRDGSLSRPLGTDSTVPPGHMLKAHVEFGISVGEIAQRLKAFGFRVPELGSSADDADALTLRLLSANLNGQHYWLGVDEPVTPGHLYRAYSELGIGIREAIRRMKAFGFSVQGASAMTDDPHESTMRLFAHDLPSPFLRTPVPARHVVRLAVALEQPVAEVVRELRTHGFSVVISPDHERLPLDLLSEGAEWGLDVHDWEELCDSGKTPPGLLVSAASRRDASLDETARDFKALGFATPGRLPPQTDPTDVVILSLDLDGHAPWCQADAPVSVRHVMQASLAAGIPPVAVASRLSAYGLVPPDTTLPAEGEPDVDFRIKAYIRDLSPHGDELPDEARPVPLHYLVSVASRLSTKPREIAEWLSMYGFQVPDDRLTQLDEDDRRLRLSLRGGISDRLSDLPLRLGAPLTDFLRTARASLLPARELAELLERLDVDLDRVREAVRAALPRVPGLVMKPEPEPEGDPDPA